MQTAKTKGEKRRIRKQRFWERFNAEIEEVTQLLVVSIDHVGSRQLAKTRQTLRGYGTIIVGKNTLMRKVLREAAEARPALATLIPLVRGNVALVFVAPGMPLAQVKALVTREFVPARARPHDTAQCDVEIPAGPTGLDPGQTSFFQALNISTKISKGAIEILSNQKVLRAGEKISLSIVALLNRLEILPFEYRITVQRVWDDGEVYPPEVLDITEDDIRCAFMRGARTMAALQLAIHYPTELSVPLMLQSGARTLVALAHECRWADDSSATLSGWQRTLSAVKPKAEADAGADRKGEGAPVPKPSPKENVRDREREAEAVDEDDDNVEIGNLFGA